MLSEIEAKLKNAFPDADINLRDYKHDGVHMVVEIASKKFQGLSLVEQHRLVYESLKDYITNGQLHALKIKTKALEN